MTVTQDRKAVYTVYELAEHLGVDPAKIYRLSKEGELPAFKVGQEWRFLKTRIDEWISDQEKKHRRPDAS